MIDALRPADAAELAAIVRAAAVGGQSLRIVGGGSKHGLGRPQDGVRRLELGALSGIVEHDAAELVLTARAATPLPVIEAALAERRQMLAFEPPGWQRLFGAGATPTLGGVVACNMAGPRRVRAGAPRDHLLGFAAVNGVGEAWQAGGKVVKNVSGYDMGKLHCGALGTLSVLTELSVRVVPLPQTACTIVIEELAEPAAIALLAEALNSRQEVSGAAYLPVAAARRGGLDGACAVLRLEGFGPSLPERVGALQRRWPGSRLLDAAATASLWSAIGAVAGLLPAGGVVWRLCPEPASAAAVLAGMRARLGAAEAFYDWGGGLVWLALSAEQAGEDGGAAVVRAALGPGHATLIVAPDAIRAVVEVFQPLAPALEALAGRVKDAFDPRRVLNPGRMRSGR